MNTVNSATNRSQALSIRLSPDIHERLQSLSERLGVKPSTLISVAIGEYLSKQEATLTAVSGMQTAIADAMAKQVAEVLNGPTGLQLQGDLLSDSAND